MVRSKGSLKSTVAPSGLSRKPQWRLRATLGVASLLAVLGVISVFSSRASSYPDTILSVADVNGGFLNGIQAIDSKTGSSLGAIDLNMPALAGCVPSRPKAYLSNLTLDQPHNVLYVSMKPCAGGTLPANQSIIVIDLKAVTLSGVLPGPSDTRTIVSRQDGIVYAVRSDGLELSVINTQSRSIVKSFSLTAPISRSGADATTGDLITVTAAGAVERFTPSGTRSALTSSQMSFPLTPQAQDNDKLLAIGNAWYTVGKQGAQWGLVKISTNGSTITAVQSEPVSMTATKNGESIFIQTACASGVQCASSPNRMYAYNVATGTFQTAGQDTWFPLQQPGGQVRFNAVGDRLFFDGVLASSGGASQRFVFPLDTNGIAPTSARIAVASSEWVVATLNDDSKLATVPPVDQSPNLPGGGGIGLNTGSISPVTIPIDEIERSLGISIKDINFDLISDAQIRAYGYDPAMVRRYVAQYKLGLAQGSTQSSAQSATNLCSGMSAGSGIDLAAIERKIGMPLSQINFDAITDDQIKQFGYEPKIVRDYVAQAKSAQSTADSCANVFTQDGFVAKGTVDAATLAAGSVANVTAEPTFDLLKGGWVLSIRWQAPGGAKKFRLYGRDNSKHKLEQQLAVVGEYDRQASFGGFSQLAFPPFYDQTYWLSVVPEIGPAQLGTPAAVKVRVQCFFICYVNKAK